MKEDINMTMGGEVESVLEQCQEQGNKRQKWRIVIKVGGRDAPAVIVKIKEHPPNNGGTLM